MARPKLPDTASNQQLLSAIAYSRRGWAVLPCRPRDKAPATRHGVKDASRERTVILGWWQRNPKANVAIACGGVSNLLVLDVDPRNGGDVQLHELQRIHGDLPETLVVETGGGGVHFYFLLPENGLRSGVLAPGLDVKANGGYVLAPPSIHPSGGCYHWRGNPNTSPIAPCPAWIVDAMERAKKPQRAMAFEGVDACSSLLGRKFEELGLMGELLADGKRAVVCPWQEAHTTGKRLDSSTVLFPPRSPGGPGSFHCLHSHCQGRTLSEVTQELERRLALASPERAWMVELRRTPKGELKCTFANLVLMLGNDPKYAGAIRLDEMRGVVMLSDAEITDATVSLIRVDFEKRYGIQPGDAEMSRAVQLVAGTNAFHPVRDYLKQLTWDGAPRLDAVADDILNVRCETEEERRLSALLVRRWFISLVARALVPGCKVDTALILEGTQGVGKSSFFRVIAGDWFSDTEMALDKDAMIQLRSAWIYEWAELENVTSRQSVSRVKAFLTSTEDRFRPPFGRTAIMVRRSGVIVGTTNTQDFLHDPSGSRRFWVIPVGAIDLGRLREAREQLLAEAVAAFASGERHWLSEDEESRREALAVRFVEVDPWEERVLEFASAQVRVRTPEVLLQALGIPMDRLNKRDEGRVAAILKRAGYRATQSRIDGRVTRYWTKPPSRKARDGGDSV